MAKWVYPIAGIFPLFISFVTLGYAPDEGALIIITVILLIMHGSLFFHYRRPGLVASIIFTGAAAHYVLGIPIIASDVLALLAVFSATRYGNQRVKVLTLIAAFIGAVVQGLTLPITFGNYAGLSGYLFNAFFIALMISTAIFAFWALASLRISRTDSWNALQERNQLLEREKQQDIELATAAERNRIAREMHDIIAHSLSVVIAQADGGRYSKNDADHLNALENISEISRAALTDMRNVLGVLREETVEPDLSPQPDSLEIHKLIDQLRESGLNVSLVEVGEAHRLPPGVGLCVYRIAQESLTNVMKHAGPDVKATVLLHWQPGRIILQVDDDGRGAAASSDGAGMGVLGMRERTQMLGGTFISGPRPGGGFRTRADIPIPLTTKGEE